jgi:hypothetical protein
VAKQSCVQRLELAELSSIPIICICLPKYNRRVGRGRPFYPFPWCDRTLHGAAVSPDRPLEVPRLELTPSSALAGAGGAPTLPAPSSCHDPEHASLLLRS